MKVKEAMQILGTMNPEDDLLGDIYDEFVDITVIEKSDPPGMVRVAFKLESTDLLKPSIANVTEHVITSTMGSRVYTEDEHNGNLYEISGDEMFPHPPKTGDRIRIEVYYL